MDKREIFYSIYTNCLSFDGIYLEWIEKLILQIYIKIDVDGISIGFRMRPIEKGKKVFIVDTKRKKKTESNEEEEECITINFPSFWLKTIGPVFHFKIKFVKS